jgi:hypothetical protein
MPSRSHSEGRSSAARLYDSLGTCYHLAADEDYLYVTDSAVNGIVRVDKSAPDMGTNGGAGSAVVLDATSADAQPIAVDQTYIYWADHDGLYRKAKDGTGTKAVLVTFPAGLPPAWTIVPDGDYVYYCAPGGVGAEQSTGVVARVRNMISPPPVRDHCEHAERPQRSRHHTGRALLGSPMGPADREAGAVIARRSAANSERAERFAGIGCRANEVSDLVLRARILARIGVVRASTSQFTTS